MVTSWITGDNGLILRGVRSTQPDDDLHWPSVPWSRRKDLEREHLDAMADAAAGISYAG